MNRVRWGSCSVWLHPQRLRQASQRRPHLTSVRFHWTNRGRDDRAVSRRSSGEAVASIFRISQAACCGQDTGGPVTENEETMERRLAGVTS